MSTQTEPKPGLNKPDPDKPDLNKQDPHPGAANAPDLDTQQQKQVERRQGISVAVVHEAVRKEGEEELARPAAALLWSGLAGGLSMGTSLIMEGLLRTHLPDTNWRPLIQQLGYPVGFLMLILGRQQLFTENTLTAMVPLLVNRDRHTLVKVLKLWAMVLASNLVGAHLVSWALSSTPIFPSDVQQAFGDIARQAAAVTFSQALIKGIVAGWLIAMMVWMLAAVEQDQVLIIILMTYAVGLASLTHIIAGSIEVLFLVWQGGLSWWAYAGAYALPTLLGNMIGGVSLVAALNHAQVVAGRD